MSTIRQVGIVGLLIAGAAASRGQDKPPTGVADRTLDQWIEALSDESDPHPFSEKREALGPNGSYAKEAVPALIEALTSANENTTRVIATILADHGRPSLPALLEALDRPEVPVRVGAISALGLMEPVRPDVVTRLLGALKDPALEVRATAAWSLGQFERMRERTIPALMAALQDENEWVRREAAFAFRDMGQDAKPAIPALIATLSDKNVVVREIAAEALRQIGPDAKSAIPTLIAALEDEDYVEARSGIVTILQEIGATAEEAVPALIKVLRSNDEYLRKSAIMVLGEYGSGAKAAVPKLIAIANNQPEEERETAIRALGKIGPEAKAAVPMLMEALAAGGRYSHFRYTVATTLGRIGPAAKPAVPALATLARKQMNGDDIASGPVRQAAAAAVMKIDPEYGAEHNIELAYLDVKLGEVPSVKLTPRPALTPEKKDRINKLIADLSGISRPDYGLAPSLSGSAFSPLPGHHKFAMGLLTNHQLEPSNALRELVEIGPGALPFLLDALDDDTPTKLKIRRGGFTTGFGSELEGNPLNARERRVLSEEPANEDAEDDEGDDDAASYTVSVGDVCFVAVGQIVGRRYSAVRYQPSAIVIINSPVQSAELRRRVRAIWSSDDPAQHLLDSLLIDYATEGIFNGRSLDGWGEGSDRQIEAAVRLLYYFPTEGAPLIAGRLKQMRVTKPADDDDAWMLREVANSVRTTEFLEAVNWCKEPAIREALLEVFQRTDDLHVLLAVAPSVQENSGDLVLPRLRAMAKELPESEESTRDDGYDLLIALARYAGESAKPDFQNYLREASLQRRWTMCWVLEEVHPEWALEFLTPMLTDKRTGYASKQIRLCDFAASTLSEIHPDLEFNYDGTPEERDRRIEQLRRQIEQKGKQ